MIYLVEDDSSIRELVIYALNSTGLEAKGFEKPSEFWKAVEEEEPSLVILDVMLPDYPNQNKIQTFVIMAEQIS